MSAAATLTLQALLVLVLAFALPWLGMRMLAPSLAASPLAQRVNFRGKTVFIGLGAAWIFWVAGMVVLRWSGQLAGGTLGLFTALGAISPLVITALLFGLLDDAYGTAADRGFRGHLKSLAHGRLTTGAFKLLGIGLVSLAAATSVVGGPGVLASGTIGSATLGPDALAVAGWTLALGALIALSANLINLADLRPGRALKFYALYAGLLVIGAPLSGATSLAGALLLGLALFGPIVAIWPLDVGERGMLGDAGANAAGAALGFVAAWECGRSWGALVVLALLLGLNLASERFSFSRIIAANPLLNYLDGLGRNPEGSTAENNSAKTSPQSSNPDG